MAATTPVQTRDNGSFDMLRQAWMGTLSASTQLAYGSDLGSFRQWSGLGSRPLAASTTDISAFQQACLGRGESPSTVRRRSSALTSFFEFAVAHQALSMNPVIGSHRPVVQIGDPSSTLILETDFVERYLSDVDRFDDRLSALTWLLACEGLKLGEALALDTDDVTGRPSSVTVRIHRAGGTQKVALNRRSSQAVHRCVGGRRNEPLFFRKPRSTTSGPHQRLTRFGADHLFKRIQGPSDGVMTANALRRYYITTAAGAGDDIDTIRRQTGIGDRRSARRYLAPPPTGANAGGEISQETFADHDSDRR